MADSHAASSAARFEVRATAADHFAWVRTRLALERTIMSWDGRDQGRTCEQAASPLCHTVGTFFAWALHLLLLLRTAVALIGFGFAIVQYLEHLQQLPGARPAYITRSPQFLGLALISCGILALLVSIWQYWWGIRYLWDEPFAPIAGVTKEGKQTPVIAVAILLVFIGLFAFFAVLLRLT